MADTSPLVTLGIPAYNSAGTLRQTVESLLTQTYPSYEFFIVDDASTDATPDIGRELANTHQGIHYLRNDRNRGFTFSMNRIFAMAKGKYVMATGDKDLREKDCLALCVDELERHPEAVLCYSPSIFFNADNPPKEGPAVGFNAVEDSTRRRLHTVLLEMERGDPVFGLMRAEALRKTRLLRNVLGNDHVLMAELSLLGSLIRLSRPVLYRREEPKPNNRTAVMKSLLTVCPDVSRLHRKLPYWYMMLDHFGAVLHSPVPWIQKAGLFWEVGFNFPRRIWSFGLKEDLKELFRPSDF